MTDCNLNPQKLREIILNARKPVVFKNFPLNWTCFQNGLEEWCRKFDESNCSASFERILKYDCLEPQWERKRELVQLKAIQFLAEHSNDCAYWSGLNYKRRQDLPASCTSGIDFAPFGFPQAGDDSTLWLCSSNANTPCHYDSYGCNIVVQVFGKKSWHLFKPDTPLTSTRIPYEESSIYCKENFYSPTEEMKKNLEIYKDFVYHVVLEPNDVLIVPKHWWHYVEAIDISLSVNTWIPLKCDTEQQIEECVVKYIMENFVKNSPLEIKTHVVNPNQLANLTTNEELFEILKYLFNQSMKDESNAKRAPILYEYHYLSENKMEQLLKEFEGVRQIPLLGSNELEHFLRPRYKEEAIAIGNKALNRLEEILLDSICSPHVIGMIKKEFFKRYKEYAFSSQ